ncbi:uncharacterized protein LOC134824275 [Bolinopsis microptera]|uniref:uncharacterized protein LOC134824275 n=1 Tax=Bolinopsis microptera TaxID=2820187 RepID=UPI003078BC5D
MERRTILHNKMIGLTILLLCPDTFEARLDPSCFKADLRAFGPVLKEVEYSSDKACMNICIATSSCMAAVISPKHLDVAICYVIGEYTLSDDNAYAWYTAERRCLETNTATNTATTPDHNPGFTLRNKNGLERRLPQRVPKNIGTACEEG